MSGRATDASRPAPPAPERRPFVLTRVTGDVTDDWYWLRDRDDPATINYLEAENAHARSFFDSTATLVDSIDTEIRSRVLQTDISAPVRHGPFWYSVRTVEGLDYPIHCRSERSDDTDPTVILDENLEASNNDFFDLGALEPSPDHRLIAWSADTRGDEHYTLRIRDLITGSELSDVIPDTTWAGIAWSADGAHLLYVVADEAERPCEVRRHRIGSPIEDDQVVFRDDDEHFYVGIGATRSGRHIVIHTASKTSSEVLLLDAADVTAPPRMVRPRAADVEYQVDDWGDRLVIVTNLDAVDFRVMTADPDSPADWEEFIPGTPGRRVAGAEPFENYLVVLEW
ncbi:MAG: oligopeptidase B, partial [Ilumatobacteraceae bacterium]